MLPPNDVAVKIKDQDFTPFKCRIFATFPSGSASSSSYYENISTRRPQLAIDGVIADRSKSSGLFHSLREMNLWLQIEFGPNPLEVLEVHVFYRMDCCAERFHDAAVMLLKGKINLQCEDIYVGPERAVPKKTVFKCEETRVVIFGTLAGAKAE
jgi:hypothetical protein